MDLDLEGGFSLDPSTGNTDPDRGWRFWLVPKTGDTGTARGFRLVGDSNTVRGTSEPSLPVIPSLELAIPDDNSYVTLHKLTAFSFVDKFSGIDIELHNNNYYVCRILYI